MSFGSSENYSYFSEPPQLLQRFITMCIHKPGDDLEITIFIVLVFSCLCFLQHRISFSVSGSDLYPQHDTSVDKTSLDKMSSIHERPVKGILKSRHHEVRQQSPKGTGHY